jgi:hypothetical protein
VSCLPADCSRRKWVPLVQQKSGSHQKKGPSVFCCLPDLAENRDNEGPALRAQMFYAQQITSYLMGKVYADKSILSGC